MRSGPWPFIAGGEDVLPGQLINLARLANISAMRVNMHEAKTNLSRLVAAVEAGEADEIEIARAGHVVARIVAPRPRSARQPGYWAGRVHLGSDFDELPQDVAAVFRGEEP